MALESAIYPTQLIDTNPTGADVKGQGDDHIRMLKRVFKNTFPNINSPITVTPGQLNMLSAGVDLFVRPNMIVMWGGAYGNIPSGWMLCNGVGTTSSGVQVPDLRDKFVAGAGNVWSDRQVGGTFTHSHGLSAAVHPTALSIAQIPSHTHTVIATQYDGNNGAQPFVATDFAQGNYGIETGAVGSGQEHNHGISVGMEGQFNIPPFMALGFIIKY